MRLRAAEKFITRETGEYECRVCSYTYVPSKGDGRDFGPGTQFRDLPPGANDTRISHCARSDPLALLQAGAVSSTRTASFTSCTFRQNTAVSSAHGCDTSGCICTIHALI